MIPQKIHYCWFGYGKKPQIVKRCIKSWKKFCPKYEIIEWNEENCDLSTIPPFVRQAYDAKKWGFVSDYFRLKIVYENGGIYLDTDCELIKSLDEVLDNSSFFGFHNGLINSGVGFGAEKGFYLLPELMKIYETPFFVLPDGTLDTRPCTERETAVFVRHGLKQDNTEQFLDEIIHIYPKEYFDPGNWGSFFVWKTERTISIHHYLSSWYSPKAKIRLFIVKIKDFVVNLRRFILFKLPTLIIV